MNSYKNRLEIVYFFEKIYYYVKKVKFRKKLLIENIELWNIYGIIILRFLNIKKKKEWKNGDRKKIFNKEYR